MVAKKRRSSRRNQKLFELLRASKGISDARTEFPSMVITIGATGSHEFEDIKEYYNEELNI